MTNLALETLKEMAGRGVVGPIRPTDLLALIAEIEHLREALITEQYHCMAALGRNMALRSALRVNGLRAGATHEHVNSVLAEIDRAHPSPNLPRAKCEGRSMVMSEKQDLKEVDDASAGRAALAPKED